MVFAVSTRVVVMLNVEGGLKKNSDKRHFKQIPTKQRLQESILPIQPGVHIGVFVVFDVSAKSSRCKLCICPPGSMNDTRFYYLNEVRRYEVRRCLIQSIQFLTPPSVQLEMMHG